MFMVNTYSLYRSELVPCNTAWVSIAATIFYDEKWRHVNFYYSANRDTSAIRVYYNLIFNEFSIVSVSKFHRENSHRDGLKNFLLKRKIIHTTTHTYAAIHTKQTPTLENVAWRLNLSESLLDGWRFRFVAYKTDQKVKKQWN